MMKTTILHDEKITVYTLGYFLSALPHIYTKSRSIIRIVYMELILIICNSSVVESHCEH